jgi:hypothetical protein
MKWLKLFEQFNNKIKLVLLDGVSSHHKEIHGDPRV